MVTKQEFSTDARAAEVVDALRAKSLTVATAESLTAGLCAASLANVPGASAVLRGGLITYATDLKARLAGVDADLLAARGPVDPVVAEQLARGAALACAADIGVGLTGVAGPEPQDGHDVGEVFVGVWFNGTATHHTVDTRSMDSMQGDDPVRSRQDIRRHAVNCAFRAILGRING